MNVTEKQKLIYREIMGEAAKLCGEREICKGCKHLNLDFDCVPLTAARIIEEERNANEQLRAESARIRQESINFKTFKLLTDKLKADYKTAVILAITSLRTQDDSTGLKQNATLDKALAEIEKIEIKL